ncbi:hypothetical protein [Leptospira ilyithenensis]|uniref:Uncharacterized protein n=1 Tax=Leptospira ilyithenensis TaxID=2484901 RepID=A0A4R9LKJ1_9LEPT|nr:hypothetical protein [Leptospira ilyithenensis]TGN06524.1 hypothetical protein EHS11_19420 [Leptospira ilyithenensis]
MIETVNITWPNGGIDPRIHCPACGTQVLSPLEDDGPGCHHVQFIIDSESGEFNYITEEFDEILEPFRKKDVPDFGEWEATDTFLDEAEADTFFAMNVILAGEREDGEDSVCLRIGYELFFDEDQQELYDELEKRHDEEGLHDHSQN